VTSGGRRPHYRKESIVGEKSRNQREARKAEVRRSLTNQPITNTAAGEAIETLRDLAKGFSNGIIDKVPESREQSLAITNLEQSVMWAVKGIVLHQENVNG
jgi:hypothetical protein